MKIKAVFLYFITLVLFSFLITSESDANVSAEAFEDAYKEQLGEIRLADFLVEPTGRFSENASVNSGFDLGNTYFAAAWKLKRSISGRIQVGDQSLLNRPYWAQTTVTQQFEFVEAYAQIDSVLGRFRAGVVPVPFGLDGKRSETELWTQRSALFRNRRLVLRDMGASYYMTYNGFFSDVSVHNGEGGRDTDKRLWQTARWGWYGPAGMQLGASGAVGYYKTTSSPTDTKLRAGNLFFGLDLPTVGLAIEGTVGEEKTKLQQHRFVNWYTMLRHNLGRDWGVLGRWEFYDPSSRVLNDNTRQGTLGLFYKNTTDTSRVTFLFIKNWEEGSQVANDEFRAVWRITSAYIN